MRDAVLAWCCAALAAAAVVDPAAPPGAAVVSLELNGRAFDVGVAFGAPAARIEAAAETFCRDHRAEIFEALAGFDEAWLARACPYLVRAAATKELRPRVRLTKKSIAVLDVADGPPNSRTVAVATVATAPAPGLGRLISSLAARDHEYVRRADYFSDESRCG